MVCPPLDNTGYWHGGIIKCKKKFGNPANQDVAKAQWYYDYANKLIAKYGMIAFNGMRIEDTDLYLDIKEMLENE